MINFVSFEPNTEAPMHVHEEEQIVLVIDGEFEFEIDGDVRTMRAGDVAVVPKLGAARGAHARDVVPGDRRLQPAATVPHRPRAEPGSARTTAQRLRIDRLIAEAARSAIT